MIRRRTSHIVLAAGGTGGHMFPALAVGQELLSRGHRVTLITDRRGLKYRKLFDGIKILEVDSTTFTGKGIIGKILALPKILSSIRDAKSLLKMVGAGAVIGFGGYPSFPTIRAAASLGIPTCLHEQNAVLGRVNRLMAKSVDAVALSFENTDKADWQSYNYVAVTGNPVRKEVEEIGDLYFPTLGDDKIFRILVIGGSQGAKIFSEVVPQAISTLPRASQRRLQVTQQCREEDIESVRAIYADTKIAVELTTFIDDLPNCLRWSHLVIGRAGASTIAELTTAGRPAILVPYPHATDNHQTANARELLSVGGAWLYQNNEFNAKTLAKVLQRMARHPNEVWQAAEESRKIGKPYAAKDLADIVERLALVKGDKSVITVNEISNENNEDVESKGLVAKR
ncbi:undecaprenyldiphospho-muramoylpentapeptide beta-N-acetylglucosaminyltransferase [Pseudemcibacter aquimaris]|uniref:undecaprenyldiphospho-muramoylpentapeptide beta-N-acetylglucosaminyltransferase n=1 Tax=Pseudemcibacter aquimaris TaxID=2857064 RepID=UPI0020130578|nr:undecaprenyldiphospho-muramoylpentapeptide beta-N-acetylglucosaminyltransferase [Pseudemcibacter aquimaris]MCC3861368.1 undecaprenyldiphospho-muramoylpentapeptide beta-N-acetylglucosaminyltransferase [Pseudemcibacter aquimaris]WDU58140.1 undecaprenyldiphospho-muramoylpentapeptide beta-N-acetylglucosaminyltransferase [Pseudemcibacter aquimaris]